MGAVRIHAQDRSRGLRKLNPVFGTLNLRATPVADSTTPNYNWTKPEIHASNNTWGSKWNDNLDEIDEAVFGKLEREGDSLEGKLTLVPSIDLYASMNIPNGAVPATPLDGDIWAVSGVVYYRSMGVTTYFLDSNGPISDVDWGGFRINGLGDGINATSAANVRQVQQGTLNRAMVDPLTGSGDVLIATYHPAPAAWVDGALFYLQAKAANTIAGVVFNPNSLGPKTVVRQGGVPLAVGDIPYINYEMVLKYSAALDQVILMNPIGSDASLLADNVFKGINQFDGAFHTTDGFLSDKMSTFTEGVAVGRATINKDTIDTPVVITVPGSGAIPWDMSLGSLFTLQMPTANRTLAAPTNVVPGQIGYLIVTNDATPRSLIWNAAYKFSQYADSVIDPTANGVAIFEYTAIAVGNIAMRKIWATSGIGGGYEDFDCGIYAPSTTVTKPNNTGGLPSRVAAFLRCETADLGYVANEWINVGLHTRDTGGGSGNNGGIQVSYNAASIFAVCPSTIYLMDKSTRIIGPVNDPTDFRLFLRVWK